VTGRLRAATAAVLLLAALTAAPDARADGGLTNLPPVTDAQLAGSVTDIDAAKSVSDLNIDASITDVQQTKKEGTTTTVTLASDILFAFGKADLSAAATTRIGELVKPVPQGATVQVYGYTDSIGTDADNLTLSQNRAQAVAAAVTAARTDLKLDVKGFGEANPVADNGTPDKDNPEGRAANRRVELRYTG